MISIAWKSICNRWPTALLAVLAISMSVALILTVEKIRRDARSSFTQTVSGTDLIIGARSGAIQLLLYSVFRIGNATNNISWDSVEDIRKRSAVDWLIPISLGDSHAGFRVLGTSLDYFAHYRFGDKQSLQLADGQIFNDVFDAVIGSEVAVQRNYRVGDDIVVAHGTGKVALVEHDRQPFKVSGILQPTGTPVDRAIHVSLQGIEAMHVDWQNGASVKGEGTDADTIRSMELKPKAVTALLVGLKSRAAVFREQRAINTYREEPLLAILPGVALQELWNLVSVAEMALMIVSICVVVAGLVNLISVLLAGLNERRREMAVLRSAGAKPAHIFMLLCIESTVLTLGGIIAGVLLHYLLTSLGSVFLKQEFGLSINLTLPGTTDLKILFFIGCAGILAGTLPALQAYRKSLADGLSQRL
ncbi:peptide ABC transporter permease [Chromatiales bacterium (ex Bugula neritina AB1)]|nr:peptide ABC transporter permease [Chromatiales bacterium (ex Bugula neritina AB1)]